MAQLRIHIHVPAPDSTSVGNVLGLLGVVGLAVTLGGLFGNWWLTALVASVELLLVAAVANYNGQRSAQATRPATAHNGPLDLPQMPPGPAQGGAKVRGS